MLSIKFPHLYAPCISQQINYLVCFARPKNFAKCRHLYAHCLWYGAELRQTTGLWWWPRPSRDTRRSLSLMGMENIKCTPYKAGLHNNSLTWYCAVWRCIIMEKHWLICRTHYDHASLGLWNRNVVYSPDLICRGLYGDQPIRIDG